MTWLSLPLTFLKLVRWPNLLITALVQLIFHQRAIIPALEQHQIQAELSFQELFLLLVCTALITAGGYVINDLFDQQIDAVNKPQRQVVGVILTEAQAYWIYFMLWMAGFAVAVLLAVQLNQKNNLWMFPVAGTALWYYSGKLKKTSLAGNLLVSLFCSLVIGIVWFAERNALHTLEQTDPGQYLRLSRFGFLYMSLAFATTLFREIVKDAEDLKGDRSDGARTFPIIAGIKATKQVAGTAGIISALLLLATCGWLWTMFQPFILMAIAGPALALGILAGVYLHSAKEKRDFHRLSQLTKWIILAGLLLPLALQIHH